MRPSSTPSSPSWRLTGARRSTPTTSPRRTACSSAGPTAATSARRTSCSCPCRPGRWTTRRSSALAERFEEAHEREYFYRFPEKPVQIVHVRSYAIGLMPSISPSVIASGGAEPPPDALAGREAVVFAGADGAPAEHDTPFYERSALRAGNVIAGPAIVEQLDSTTVVPPGTTARVLPDGAIIIDLAEEAGVRHERDRRAHRPDHPRRPGRRLPGDRPGDGARAQAHGLQPRRPAGGGPRRRPLHRRRPRDLRVRHDADAHRLDPGLHPGVHAAAGGQGRAGRHHHPQQPVPRGVALARPVRRDPDLLGGRAHRLVGVDDPPLRHRRGVPGHRHRRARRLGGVEDLRLAQALRARRAQRAALAVLHRQHPDAELRRRRHGGDDRGGAPGREAIPRAAREVRPRHGAHRRRGVPRLLRADDARPDRVRARRHVGGRRLARRRRAQPRRAALRPHEGDRRGIRHHRRPLEVLRQRRRRASTCRSAAASCPASTP